MKSIGLEKKLSESEMHIEYYKEDNERLKQLNEQYKLELDAVQSSMITNQVYTKEQIKLLKKSDTLPTTEQNISSLRKVLQGSRNGLKMMSSKFEIGTFNSPKQISSKADDFKRSGIYATQDKFFNNDDNGKQNMTTTQGVFEYAIPKKKKNLKQSSNDNLSENELYTNTTCKLNVNIPSCKRIIFHTKSLDIFLIAFLPLKVIETANNQIALQAFNAPPYPPKNINPSGIDKGNDTNSIAKRRYVSSNSVAGKPKHNGGSNKDNNPNPKIEQITPISLKNDAQIPAINTMFSPELEIASQNSNSIPNFRANANPNISKFPPTHPKIIEEVNQSKTSIEDALHQVAIIENFDNMVKDDIISKYKELAAHCTQLEENMIKDKHCIDELMEEIEKLNQNNDFLEDQDINISSINPEGKKRVNDKILNKLKTTDMGAIDQENTSDEKSLASLELDINDYKPMLQLDQLEEYNKDTNKLTKEMRRPNQNSASGRSKPAVPEAKKLIFEFLERIKTKKKFILKNLMVRKQMYKLITNIYQNLLAANKANISSNKPFRLKVSVQEYAYNHLLNRYGNEKFAKLKYRQFLKSLITFHVSARVQLFMGFMGLIKDVSEQDIHFYIRALHFINNW